MPVVELEQGRMHHVDEGDGPPVVLLHGALVDSALWRDLVPRLVAAGHRVVAPDLPLGSHRLPLGPRADLSPHGVARLAADVLEALDLRDVTLVGNDTGGAIAQLVATSHGERIGRLVLTSCDLEDNFPPKAFQGPVKVAAYAPGVMRLIGAGARLPRLVGTPAGYGWLVHDPDPALTTHWLTPLRTDAPIRADTRRAFALVEPGVTWQTARDLARFARPALWAWSGADRFFPEAPARRLAATMPDARFTTIPGAYTFSPLDAPDRLATLIADFSGQRRGPAEAGPGNAATAQAV